VPGEVVVVVAPVVIARTGGVAGGVNGEPGVTVAPVTAAELGREEVLTLGGLDVAVLPDGVVRAGGAAGTAGTVF